jgi:hypothetical protein
VASAGTSSSESENLTWPVFMNSAYSARSAVTSPRFGKEGGGGREGTVDVLLQQNLYFCSAQPSEAPLVEMTDRIPNSQRS